jgi:hypothetical protein
MEQSPSWETNNHPSGQEIPHPLWSWRVINMFTSVYAIQSLSQQGDRPSTFSKLSIIQQWCVPVTWICLLHKKNYRNPNDVSQISDASTIMWPEIQLASTVIACTWGKMRGSAASGGWEKYSMAVEHACITNMF